MREHNTDKVQLSWSPLVPIPGVGNVLDLKPGVADGDYFAETKGASRYTVKPTGTGKLVRIKSPQKHGMVTITMDRESEEHNTLLAIVLADDLAANLVGPLVKFDGMTGRTTIYKNAFIQTEPDEVSGTGSGTYGWVFGYEQRIVSPGPPNSNVVGA